MKRPNIKIALFAMLSLPIFSACNDDDGYSSPEQWEALATVYPIEGTSSDYYLRLDDGSELLGDLDIYTPKGNQLQRVYVNYTQLIKDDINQVKINWISDILTKGVIDLTAENEDSIGNDPIKIHSLWIGDDFLNIYFGLNSGNQQAHLLNLVNNKTAFRPDDSKIYLEFRHNANDDPEWYPSDGFVAFDLRPYKELLQDLDSVELVIGVQDFDNGYKTYKIKYKFGNHEAEILPLKYGQNNDATLFR